MDGEKSVCFEQFLKLFFLSFFFIKNSHGECMVGIIGQ